LAALPAGALAGCPGCEEYTLDIPEEEPEEAPVPAPSTAPTPAAPASPATTPATTESSVPEAEVTVTEDEFEPPEPVDPDDDPVPERAVKPAPLSNVPAVAASQANDLESSSPGGIWPLAIAMVAVAIVGAGLGLSGRRTAREVPDAAGSRSGNGPRC
jgi:hypothetical protein